MFRWTNELTNRLSSAAIAIITATIARLRGWMSPRMVRTSEVAREGAAGSAARRSTVGQPRNAGANRQAGCDEVRLRDALDKGKEIALSGCYFPGLFAPPNSPSTVNAR